MASRLWLYLVGFTALFALLLYCSVDDLASYRDTWRIDSIKEEYSLNLIMFVESSGEGRLNGRTCCALESTAKHNPEKTVVLWYHGRSFATDNPFTHVVESLGNVQLRKIQPENIFKNTPLESWYASGVVNRSRYRVAHLSDALRLALVYKFGGAYMDIDIVSLRPVSGLRNCISQSQKDMVANGFLFLDHGHPFLLHCMRRFAKTYNPKKWGENGPRLLRSVLLGLCNKRSVRDIIGQPCGSVTVLPHELFLPINYTQWTYFFEREHFERTWTLVKNSYVMHVFGAYSHAVHVKENDGSAYEAAAKLHCPESFSAAIEHQGYF